MMKIILFTICSIFFLQHISISQVNCNTWLSTPNQGAYATFGDIDVYGNAITVEAMINRTAPLNSGLYYGHIVSKHTGTSNANYTLLPNGCEITTSAGYYSTFQTCPPVLNKTYHVAMVYDGSTLKFYRNGYLLSSQPCTGTLVTNDFPTTIAQISSSGNPSANQFLGNANEVRIWNVARTQAQIRQYMNNILPSPTTQSGLLAYYTFDNLNNKQGNTSFNGSLVGSATINATNPNCNFQADSCGIAVPPVMASTKIINDYAAVLNYNPCKNELIVDNGMPYKIGDTVVVMQMKGAVIDSTNTANFGNIINIGTAGNYEFNYVSSVAGNNVGLRNTLLHSYNFANGKVQLIRVPYFNNYTSTDTLTCLPWTGSKGGVIILNCANQLTLNQPIDVSERGFAAGNLPQITPSDIGCNQNLFFYPSTSDFAACKGESITSISNNIIFGKGKLATGGGGGNSHNSGGGGGSYMNTGGFGGFNYDGSCPNVPFDNRGIGGVKIDNYVASNRVFMGGGGGLGHRNNGPLTDGSKGNGGGIAIVIAGSILGNQKILANGGKGYSCISNTTSCHDAMGGGGAGGAIILNTNSVTTALRTEVNGGNGGNMVVSGFGKVGPGGGGSGGLLYFSQIGVPSNITTSVFGGISGVCTALGNDKFGATDGGIGSIKNNYIIPISTQPFIPAIDSVRFSQINNGCRSFQFTGIPYASNNTNLTWQWTFGDGSTSSLQNPSHQFLNTGIFTVQIKINGPNNCLDSFSKNITVTGFNTTVSPNDTICHGKSKQLLATGGVSYSWLPTTYLNNATISNPIVTPMSNITYYITITDASGCTVTDSVKIKYNPAPTFSIASSKPQLCLGDTMTLQATGGDSYLWSPLGVFNNVNSDIVIATPQQSGNLSVQIINNTCSDTLNLSKNIIVSPLPIINLTKSNDVSCAISSSTITASGANTYTWSPANYLNTISGNVVTATLNQTQLYRVVGTSTNGCADTASITINFNPINSPQFLIPNTFTPNNDGVNDCFGIKHWGNVQLELFEIYNRWGQKVFSTTTPSTCWDGKFNGIVQGNAAYVYQIKGSIPNCGKVYLKGTLILTK